MNISKIIRGDDFMERNCLRCNEVMKVAELSAGTGYAKLEQKGKGINAKVCFVDAYVCPKCGYVEVVAQKPEIVCE